MLALSVISQAAREDRSWFLASRTQKIFRFWATVAGLNPAWVQERLEKSVETYCPGLYRRSRSWYLDIFLAGRRERVKIGRDLSRAAAAKLGLQYREAMQEKARATM